MNLVKESSQLFRKSDQASQAPKGVGAGGTFNFSNFWTLDNFKFPD